MFVFVFIYLFIFKLLEPGKVFEWNNPSIVIMPKENNVTSR